MIKHLLSITLLSAGLTAGAQSFSGMYPFTGVSTSTTTGNTGTTDPTPTPTATGVTFGAFTAVGTPTNTSAGGVFAFSGWTTGATNGNDVYSSMTQTVDLTKYYDVSLTPASGYEVSLTSITFNMNRSGTGPRTFVWRSNRDGFAANLPASVGTNTNISVQTANVFLWTVDSYTTNTQQKNLMVTLGGTDFTAQTTAYNFRLYPYNAEAGGGTFRIDTVTFNGSASLATGLGKISFDLNSNFNVYPVPSHDGVLFIESKNMSDLSKIEVLDVLGNVVLTSSKNDPKIKLNLTDMPDGNYFVRMYSGTSVSTKKIVILK
ncbi:MAG: T9SS type A sorting domain-containing protein [Bacteroidetes bacterium]|nr:T9SS type A sorting domain-containing protein [Bacteroidota bacterium]